MENRPIVPPTSQPPPPLVETVGGESRIRIIPAIVAGAASAFIAAVMWAAIVSITGWQIGFFAIGVGLIVGVAVRRVGNGASMALGVIAAIFALVGTLLGDFFAVATVISKFRGVGILEMFTADELPFALNGFTRAFDVINFLFYGLAVYTAFNAAGREGAQGVRS